MAGIDVISNAAGELEEAVLQLQMFVQTCEALDDNKCPPWLFIVGGHSHAIHDATQAYLAAVHQHAAPHLRDLANASKPGGMGGTPMSTQRDELAYSGARGVAGVSGANSVGVAPAGAGAPILNLRK